LASFVDFPHGFKKKMRINIVGDAANQKKFIPAPTAAQVEASAVVAGFNHKIYFPERGWTKYYKFMEGLVEFWFAQRSCLNAGGVLPIVYSIGEAELIRQVHLS
jgi:hypothetical protein